MTRFSLYQKKYWRLFLFLEIALLSGAMTHLVDLSSALGGFTAGATLALAKNRDNNAESSLLNRITAWLTPLFF